MKRTAFVTQKERLVRGALLSLLLAGCSHKAGAPPDVYSLQITPANLADVRTSVVESTMPAADKISFTKMLAQHVKTPRDLQGKTVREMILEEHAYDVGVRLSKQERANENAHDRAIAELMTLDVRSHREAERQITLTMRIVNKTAKTIASLDCGIEVHDRKGTRIGMAEFDFDQAVKPHQSVTFDHAIRYVTFGPDAGSMRLAYQQPKTVSVDVKKVHYKDGSERGYDD